MDYFLGLRGLCAGRSMHTTVVSWKPAAMP